MLNEPDRKITAGAIIGSLAAIAYVVAMFTGYIGPAPTSGHGDHATPASQTPPAKTN
jgi:hypothetical protein